MHLFSNQQAYEDTTPPDKFK
ncbi:hypothetical protein CBM2634_U70028 [Cupriavidus taiwanensis]|uniref:Uncharacterized protein n=1 Tax=Cupriavidus taiwanensis TaxID=164546 RepID=A0A375JHI4_9BURK|nr:hypothetical protein CBM2634_U70028 [Cupriavidus taiwanensis]